MAFHPWRTPDPHDEPRPHGSTLGNTHSKDRRESEQHVNETPVTLVGNVGGDPDLRFTPDGTAVCKFSLACTPRKLNRNSNEWRDGETSWFNVSVWRGLAENVAESLRRGDQVIVRGALSVRQYETREGGKGTSVDVEAYTVGLSLQFGTAQLTKAASNGNAAQRPGNGGRGGAQPAGQPPARPQQAATPPSNDW